MDIDSDSSTPMNGNDSIARALLMTLTKRVSMSMKKVRDLQIRGLRVF